MKHIFIIIFLISSLFCIRANIVNDGSGAIFTRDFIIEVKRGNIPGYILVHRSGINDAIGTSIEDVWNVGGYKTSTTNALTLEVFSGNGGDITNGAGARQIIVEGLNENWVSATATYDMYGTTTNQSVTNKFIRVFNIYVSNTGTYSITSTSVANAGTITVQYSNGGNIVGKIQSNSVFDGMSKDSSYTIPTNYTGFLLSGRAFVESSKACTIYYWNRLNANDIVSPFSPRQLMVELKGAEKSIDYNISDVQIIPQLTDIWFSGVTASGTAGVTIDYEILLIRNDLVSK